MRRLESHSSDTASSWVVGSELQCTDPGLDAELIAARDDPADDCDVSRTLEVLDGKWTTLIVYVNC